MTPTFWLSTHLGYACRHSGACCTARWPIPLERVRVPAVQAAIASGLAHAPPDWYHPAPHAPADVAGILALAHDGACVFHRVPRSSANAGGGCAIHPMRPAACEHFPYVAAIDPRGVHVTLSHFCPTAAAMLFDTTGPPRRVEGPSLLVDGRVPEGLDARDALPPADDGGARLWSWDEVTAWETRAIEEWAADRRVPPVPNRADFERARAAVLPGHEWPAAPDALEALWGGLVAPAWPQWVEVVGRYLAAKVHGSWAMHLGTGPRDVERVVRMARTVLQVEAVRQAAAGNRPLDRPALVAAIRQSDLLLVHLTDPATIIQP